MGLCSLEAFYFSVNLVVKPGNVHDHRADRDFSLSCLFSSSSYLQAPLLYDPEQTASPVMMVD